MMKKLRYTMLAMLLAVIFFAPAMAQEGVSQEEMEARFMEAMTPNEQHKWLEDNFVGNFTYKQTVWMDPAADPIVSEGKAQGFMAFEGRFLKENMAGENAGMPFMGENTLAYNTVDKSWDMSWIDNMGTGIMYGTGKREGETLDFICTFPSMFEQGDDTFRIHREVVDKDHHTYTMYTVDKQGKESKWMFIEYVRVK
jgi:hypothetical protein